MKTKTRYKLEELNVCPKCGAFVKSTRKSDNFKGHVWLTYHCGTTTEPLVDSDLYIIHVRTAECYENEIASLKDGYEREIAEWAKEVDAAEHAAYDEGYSCGLNDGYYEGENAGQCGW